MADEDVDTRFLPSSTNAPGLPPATNYPDMTPGVRPATKTQPPDGDGSILGTSWSSLGEAGKRGIGLGTRDVAQGAIGQLLDLAGAPGRAIGLGSATLPSRDYIDPALTAVGLPQPTTTAEQYISAANRGAASALPYMLAGSIPGLAAAAPVIASRLAPATAPALATQAGMGAGGGVAGDVVQRELPPSTPNWVRPIAGLLGSLGGAATVGGLARTVGRIGNWATGQTNEIYDALGRLGINRNLVGTVSSDPTAQLIEASSGRTAIGSTIMQPERQRVINQFGNAVDNTAGRFGDQSTATAAGTVLQDQARKWITDTFPNQIEAPAWEPVNKALSGTLVTPDAYRTTLQNLVSPPGALPTAQQPFMPKAAQTWLEKLNADVPEGGSMTWDQAKQLRSSIGAAMGTPDIVQSVGMDNLKKAYGGIASDMGDTAAANGMGDAFINANKVSTTGHHFIEGTLRNVVRANNPTQENISPDTAAKTVLGSGDTTLQAIRSNLPDAADALAAYQLRRLATAQPSQAGKTGGETSTESFLTGLDRMRQNAPAGTDALFSSTEDPLMPQRMRDLGTAAAALRATNRMANTSGTGATGQVLGAGGLGTLGYLLSGGKGAGAMMAAPMVWNAGLSAAARNPVLARYMATPAPAIPSRALAAAISNLPSPQQGQGLLGLEQQPQSP